MIPRYSRPEMAAIWQAENYFRIQLEIETLANIRSQAVARSAPARIAPR